MKDLDTLFEAVKDVCFYADANDYSQRFVEFENPNGDIEFTYLDSDAFKGFLLMKLYELYGKDGGKDCRAMVSILNNILSYQRAYSHVEVFARTSGNLKSDIEYDLKTADQKTVKVTPNGWTVSPRQRRFLNSDIALTQKTPIPTTKTPFELLSPFVNLEGEYLEIFVIWLIQAYTKGLHHALWILADKGSGKSSLSRIIRRLLDPCALEITPFPTKTDDLYTQLYNSCLCCFDNIRKISNDVSDIFCRSVTGNAIGKRTLYTTNNISAMTLHNIIVINGIDIIPEQDDLAERLLILKLTKLSSNKLRPESEIWQDFDDALPEILGSIFNTLSKAMIEIKSIEAKKLPRMADSFIEMLAIAKALDISEERFREIYSKNKEILEQVRLNSPVVSAVREYMAAIPGRKFSGKAADVYNEIRDNFSGDKSLLPGSPSHFAQALDKEHSNLLKAGFRANIDDTGAKSTDISIIKRKK